jgi:hypothetical protein
VKYVLTKLKRQSIGDAAFIICHLPSNKLPRDLIPTVESPVFCVECVSVSLLRNIVLREIVGFGLNPTGFDLSEPKTLMGVVLRTRIEDMMHSSSDLEKIQFSERYRQQFSEGYQQL